MTTTVSIIRDKLIANASVSALVSTRIFPNVMPQNTALPAIVLTEISNTPEHSFTSRIATTLRSVRLQVDCYGRATAESGAYAKVHALADAVEAAIGDIATPDLSVLLENRRDLYDDVSQFHRVTMDFIVWR